MIRLLQQVRSCTFGTCLSLLCLGIGTSAHAAKLVLVVDDLGNNLKRDRQVLELPGPVTFAVLPFAPYSLRIAQLANAAGKEVILHQPMQSQRSHHQDEDGNLTLDMAPTEFNQTLAKSLAAIPSIVGVSNHTGSLLTEQAVPMQRFMQTLQDYQLFFLDSRTTPNTVATKIAKQLGVPTQARDVFLDNSRDVTAIHKQFERSLTIARRQGHAIIIAHPYPESLSYLYDVLHTLPDDIHLTALSDVMPHRQVALVPLESPRSLHKSPDPLSRP